MLKYIILFTKQYATENYMKAAKQKSKTPNPLSRRDFIKTGAIGAVGLAGILSGCAFVNKEKNPPLPL